MRELSPTAERRPQFNLGSQSQRDFPHCGEVKVEPPSWIEAAIAWLCDARSYGIPRMARLRSSKVKESNGGSQPGRERSGERHNWKQVSDCRNYILVYTEAGRNTRRQIHTGPDLHCQRTINSTIAGSSFPLAVTLPSSGKLLLVNTCEFLHLRTDSLLRLLARARRSPWRRPAGGESRSHLEGEPLRLVTQDVPPVWACRCILNEVAMKPRG